MDWLKQIAPTIATAMGGPLAGMAVSAISKAIGVDPDKVGDLISSNKLSAELKSNWLRLNCKSRRKNLALILKNWK